MGKKNIIFYFSDQQRWDTVNEEVTPNLCELAKEGIKYENNFTCQPVADRQGHACKQVFTLHNAVVIGMEFRFQVTLRRLPTTLMKQDMKLLISANGI